MIPAALAWALFWHFFLFSLMGIGGFMVTVPEVYRWLVTDSGLLSPDAFRSAIALGQASPGPNSLIVWVLGWFVAGPLGALCALLGYTIPFSTLAVVAGRFFRAHADSLLVRAYRTGMAPVSIALLYATGWTLMGPAPGVAGWLVAGITTLVVWRTRVPMMALIAAGAALGALGLF